MNERLSKPGPPSEDPGESAQGEPPEAPEPQVPLPEGFKVGKVTVLPEDTSVRDQIREEFERPGPYVRRDLSDTGLDRPAASRGHKGRGGGKQD